LAARKVGVFGGGSMAEMGPVADMQLFFDCIEVFAVRGRPRPDWSVVTDRLYRRYVQREDTGTLRELLRLAEEEFSRTLVAELGVNRVSRTAGPSSLNLRAQNLGQVFARYFTSLHEIAEESLLAWDSAKSDPTYRFQAPRVCFSDMGAIVVEQDRPCSEYDALEGPPLWRR